MLRGGQHSDTFVFTEGSDLIEDFNGFWDTIWLDPDVLGGGAITSERAVEFATVIGGSTVFDFGEGNQLAVIGITDPATLIDDIAFL